MLEAHNITFRFSAVTAPVLENVSLHIAPGEIVGLTGPSGRGKSTLARLLCGHYSPLSGQVRVDGLPLPRKGLLPVQLLAQSPVFAVNQRWSIGRIIQEAWNPDEATRIGLGVRKNWYERYPHELSGGELQRVSILRSLAPGVRYLVADEISSMLDPITQAEIWQFLRAYVDQKQIGMLAISHDQTLLETVADRTERL